MELDQEYQKIVSKDQRRGIFETHHDLFSIKAIRIQ